MDDADETSGRLMTCNPKDWLVRARQRLDCCFVLLDGMVSREQSLSGGRRQIVGLHVPGDMCCLTSLADGHADHDLFALSPVSCVAVSHRQMRGFADTSSEFAQTIWREMSRESVISAAWMTNLGQRRAFQRLAYFMCELEARLRASGQDTNAGIEWPGTQSDVGAATGLSLVHVNKTLRRLEAEALITSGRCMTYPDVAKLRLIAGFDPSYLALERETLGEMLLSRIGGADGAAKETVSGLPGDLSTGWTVDRPRMVN